MHRIALHRPQSVSHKYLRLFFPDFLRITKNNFSKSCYRSSQDLEQNNVLQAAKIFPECRQMYWRKVQRPKCCTSFAIKNQIKGSLHYHWRHPFISSAFCQGNAGDFCTWNRFQSFFGSYRKFPSIVIYATNQWLMTIKVHSMWLFY